MAGLILLCLLESFVGAIAITACFLMLCQAGEQWALIPIFLGEGSWKQVAEQKCFVGGSGHLTATPLSALAAASSVACLRPEGGQGSGTKEPWRFGRPFGSTSCRWQTPWVWQRAFWCRLTEWESALVRWGGRSLLCGLSSTNSPEPITGDGLHLYRCEGSGG